MIVRGIDERMPLSTQPLEATGKQVAIPVEQVCAQLIHDYQHHERRTRGRTRGWLWGWPRCARQGPGGKRGQRTTDEESFCGHSSPEGYWK
jgi:hypothetical protein